MLTNIKRCERTHKEGIVRKLCHNQDSFLSLSMKWFNIKYLYHISHHHHPGNSNAIYHPRFYPPSHNTLQKFIMCISVPLNSNGINCEIIYFVKLNKNIHTTFEQHIEHTCTHTHTNSHIYTDNLMRFSKESKKKIWNKNNKFPNWIKMRATTNNTK